MTPPTPPSRFAPGWLRSLGYRTDAIFSHFHGGLRDLGDALVLSQPGNPDQYFGNLVVSRDPPRDEDLSSWEARFAEHVGVPPLVNHRLFGWDVAPTRPPRFEAFLRAGYRLEENVVMSAEALHAPPHPARDAQMRPLADLDHEWEAVIDGQVLLRTHPDEAGYRAFKKRQFRGYRAMVRAGRGFWYGAFLDGRLVADLGVFAGEGVLRYQSVGTHPEFRRRGLCGTLAHFASTHAQAHFGVLPLVIVADDHDVAKRVYASVGFRDVERQQLLLRVDPS